MLDCVTDIPAIATPVGGVATVALNDDIKRIRVRWPVNACGIFSPLQRNDQCASSCPYRSSARAIAHANICTLTLLFKDLMKSLIRNLSATIRGAGNVAAGAGYAGSRQQNTTNKVTVALPDQPNAELILEYLRPPGYRRLPESQALQCFRTAVWDETAKNTVQNPLAVEALTMESGKAFSALRCRGTDRRIGGRIGAPFQKEAQSYYDAQFVGVQSAQLPTYLVFCMQKTMDMTNHSSLHERAILSYADWTRYNVGAVASGNIDSRAVHAQYLMRNTMRNASIDKFSLEIQSAAGNYTFSGEFPYLRNRSELYRDIRKHVNLDFPEEGIWDKHESCIILHVSDFARSLSSDGTSYPCSFSAKVRFVNKAQHIFGRGVSGSGPGNGIYPQQDAIWGTPLMIGLFPRQSLTLSPSSGILASQNISHSSSEEILSRM